MVDLRDIRARAEAARTPAASYWLVVIACFVMHLFPSFSFNDQLAFEKAKPAGIVVTVSDLASRDDRLDALPGPIVFVLPDGGFRLLRSAIGAAPVVRFSGRPYQATGPPRFS